MDNSILTLNQLRFHYDGRVVVDIPRLEIPRGRVTVLAGENGSGKTTLLKLLNALLKPSSGTILYKGKDTSSEGYPLLRAESVLVHQNPYLFSGTVFQNVAYGLRLRKQPASIIRSQVEEYLTLLGLSPLIERKGNKLSGGEKQRAAIARALILKPEVVLLDEPTANVDPLSVGIIEELIRKSSSAGRTVILSTHNMAFAYRTCDKLLLMEGGVIKPAGVNIFRGSSVSGDDRFTYFNCDGLQLKCPSQTGPFNTAVLPLEDVILSEKELTTSALNSFSGVVLSIKKEGSTYRIALDCGPVIETYITGYSLAKLQIKKGKKMFVTFKASAIRLF